MRRERERDKAQYKSEEPCIYNAVVEWPNCVLVEDPIKSPAIHAA
jgi:hypothetical protein